MRPRNNNPSDPQPAAFPTLIPTLVGHVPRVVLVAVQDPRALPGDMEASLAELQRLCESLGCVVTGTVEQRRAPQNAAQLLGDGKVAELKARCGGVDAVVVDEEISPSQQAGLEQAVDLPVLDRTAVILRIFERQARTREARLSVELARLEHETPRLRERTHLADRSGGGGRGGKGHTGVELAKQRARERMAHLRRELDELARDSGTRQHQRRAELRVALVGYTNAGKSSLMRALTGSDVLVEDRLFATLGTTVRVLQPDRPPRVLVSDTVGFVRRLPHALVPSFRTTLEEAAEADLLLLVVDASDPEHAIHLQVTRDTLADVARGTPSLVVLNKVDRVAPEALSMLTQQHAGGVPVCALDDASTRSLAEHIRARMEEAFTREESLLVPYARPEVLAQVHQHATVLDTRFSPQGTRVRVRAPAATLGRLRNLLG